MHPFGAFMLDVHPPHESAHTWRDFLIHIGTIVVGLLIAISLEQSVEWMHHRHELREAEASLHDELQGNQSALQQDELQLDATEQELNANLQLLQAARAHQPVNGTIQTRWEWNGMQSAAWDTIHATGAVALIPYERAHAYGLIYGQQALLNEQATLYIRSIYRSRAGLPDDRSPANLSPAALDAMVVNTQQTLVDLQYVRDLCLSLDHINKRAASEL
jgi:hypothetical protein